jgi:Carboxypeptidase regulatory-like domain/Bacterial Ig domain
MEWRQKVLWQATGVFVLLLGAPAGIGRGVAAQRPAAGRLCSSGTYVVKGRSLIRSAVPRGEDAVVLSMPGETEGAAPAVVVQSGCPEAPITLEATKGGTRLSARLSGCTGVDGEVVLRAKVDRTCRTMRGKLAAADAGKNLVRGAPFTAARNGGVPGRVLGKVSARHGDATVFLPGMKVFLVKRAGRRVQHPTAKTDATGSFSIAGRRTGEFDVCASGNGFRRICAPEPIRFGADEPAAVDKQVVVTVGEGAVHGKVLLADGSRCSHPASFLDPGVAATVARDGGRPASVPANAFGEYLLPGLGGPGSYTVAATCGSMTTTRSIAVGADELAGSRALDLTIPNSSPIITLVAAWQDGHGVRTAAPGSSVDVVAEVEDPDGDPLHFAWADDAGSITSVDAPRVRWTLKATPAENVVNVVVSDGKGGYAEKQVVVRAGVPFTRFTGTVKDPAGTPIADAKVTVGDQVVQTDAEGFFRVKAANAARYVLTVKAAGHALWSRAFDADAVGLDVVLKPAKRFTADPTADIEVQEGADGATIRVPAGSLVDADGNPPAGPVDVLVSTYDPDQEGFPGDGLGEIGGEIQGMQLQTCLWMTVTDATGRRFNLAPGARAELAFKVPRTIGDEPPATLSLVRFDEASGRWVEDGVAALQDGRYVAPVKSLTSSGISLFRGGACLRIEADDNSLENPFYLKIIDSNDGYNVTVFITQHITPIYGLPPNTFHFLQARPKSNPSRIIATAVPKTGANLSPPTPPFPYAGCTRVQLKAQLPTNHWLYEFSFGDEISAQGYYQKIGAIPAKDTFQKWLTTNGFESGFRSNDVVFFNGNEIGLGRRVNCRKHMEGFQTIVGCYNTKFGEVGGNVDQMLEETADFVSPGDTVAMEFSPGGYSAGSNAKFYIYGPDGKLKTKTAFDTEGYVKYVPYVCLHCHSGPLGSSHALSEGKFVTLDPHEYTYMKSGPYTLDNQQERFRQLNEMISYAVQHTGPPWKLMQAIYPSTSITPGVHIPGTKAIRQPVPDAWRTAPEIWTEIVKPSCRTCHMNFDHPNLTWETMNGFFDIGGNLMCSNGEMPNAMAPQLRLFRSTNPFLPDVFNTFFNGHLCRYNGVWAPSSPPTVTIMSPADQSHHLYGTVKGVHFAATASDPDGTAVTIMWLDQAGNTIGFGTSIDKVFPKPGVQKIRAIAHDQSGTPSIAAEITIYLDNSPPTLGIVSPLPSGTFYRMVPYGVQATVFDSNRDVTCDMVVWESDFYSPQKGCEPFPYAFQTLGQHTFTVHVTDPAGATVTQTRTVNVVEAPPHTPPVVAIFQPLSGAVLDPFATTELGATLGDPDIDDCLTDPNVCNTLVFPTYKWTVRFGATFEKVIPVDPDATGHFLLNPFQRGIAGCGPTPIDLVFKATDSDGMTATAVRRVTLAFPPC